jgi:3',5'-cyclic-AMP phosphodiesterase
MKRREFLKEIALGLAAGWAAAQLPRPALAASNKPALRLAVLADAHLVSGADRQAAAGSLARAVAEIRSLSPAPDLVLFAGDLAHGGRADALDLGREILADLPAPLLLVRGEGDDATGTGQLWRRRFGASRFSQAYRGCHLVGLNTALSPSPAGPVFALGPEQCRWLKRELAALDPATPLIVLSHAPLGAIFRPWQQWTQDAAALMPLLSRFQKVICLHGHVHQSWTRGQGPVIYEVMSSNLATFTENRQPQTADHLALPATSFPQPLPWQGTPANLRPGRGLQGCGWLLLTCRPGEITAAPQLWQA